MKHKEMQAVMFFSDHMSIAESLLSECEQGQLYAALRAYTMEGVLPDMQGRRKEWAALFDFMRSYQDKYMDRYQKTCERNRAAANKRWHQASGHTPGSPDKKQDDWTTGIPGIGWL